MTQQVLSVPLLQGREDFTLSRLQNSQRLNELEFYFPLQSITPGRLKDLFARHAGPHLPTSFPERIGRLKFAPVKGFMKGFIDMIFRFEDSFYLVDWKSNFLGNRVEDYHHHKLAEVMESQFYVLQYFMYSLALNQYLVSRLPDYDYEHHFGGVFYIFLRGVNPEMGSEYGIYHDRPSRNLIEALRKNLIDETGVGLS
jgi:exodeoxyribonuclease V beta subunit